MYMQTLLNARDKNLNIRLPYNEFSYKNTKDDYKLEDIGSGNKAYLQTQICKIPDIIRQRKTRFAQNVKFA